MNKAKQLINKKEHILSQPFEVNSICREDLTEYLTKKEIAQLDDGQMRYIASKLGDALQDTYWISLEVIIDDLIKPVIKNK